MIVLTMLCAGRIFSKAFILSREIRLVFPCFKISIASVLLVNCLRNILIPKVVMVSNKLTCIGVIMGQPMYLLSYN